MEDKDKKEKLTPLKNNVKSEIADVAFDTKNGRGSHRQGDLNILKNYYVGSLNR